LVACTTEDATGPHNIINAGHQIEIVAGTCTMTVVI